MEAKAGKIVITEDDLHFVFGSHISGSKQSTRVDIDRKYNILRISVTKWKKFQHLPQTITTYAMAVEVTEYKTLAALLEVYNSHISK